MTNWGTQGDQTDGTTPQTARAVSGGGPGRAVQGGPASSEDSSTHASDLEVIRRLQNKHEAADELMFQLATVMREEVARIMSFAQYTCAERADIVLFDDV